MAPEMASVVLPPVPTLLALQRVMSSIVTMKGREMRINEDVPSYKTYTVELRMNDREQAAYSKTHDLCPKSLFAGLLKHTALTPKNEACSSSAGPPATETARCSWIKDNEALRDFERCEDRKTAKLPFSENRDAIRCNINVWLSIDWKEP